MTQEQVTLLLVSFFGVIGGGGAVIVAIIRWASDRIADNINIRTAAAYDAKLEALKQAHAFDLIKFKDELDTQTAKLRDEFVQQQNYIDRSLHVFSATAASTHPRLLTAVDELWAAILGIRKETGQTFFLYSMSRESFEHNKRRIEELTPLKSFDQIQRDVFDKNDIFALEKIRPFVGEKLWTQFFVYQAFSRRLFLKLSEGKVQGGVKYWDKEPDGELDTFLTDVLPLGIENSSDLKMLRDLPQGQFVDAIRKYLEQKMIDGINEIIFGRKLTNLSFDEQMRLSKLAKSLVKESDEPLDLK